MAANNFTIADPKDADMMDVVGFDASAPELMRQFVAQGYEEDEEKRKLRPEAAGGGDTNDDVDMDAQWDDALAA